ncbi:MAG: alpha/beta fold hydrolase [Chitinophagaceae bacterium]
MATKLARELAFSFYRTKFRLLSALSKKKAAEVAFELFCTPQFRKKNLFLKNFSTAEKLSFKIDGETVRGYRWNKGGSRKVLIAHGFNSSVTSFDKYIQPLIEKGYEVLAFDAPAHGHSTGKTINAAVYSEMIKYIYENYGPIQSFMAHSFGGLGVSLALEQIPHDENYRLVLIAPATESKTAIDFFFSFMKLDKEVRKEFDDMILRMRQKPSEWYSVSRVIKDIRAKVFWFHDEGDDITPWRDAQKVKEQNYPHIQFVVTKGLGHRKIFRDEKVLQSIVDFL